MHPNQALLARTGHHSTQICDGTIVQGKVAPRDRRGRCVCAEPEGSNLHSPPCRYHRHRTTYRVPTVCWSVHWGASHRWPLAFDWTAACYIHSCKKGCSIERCQIKGKAERGCNQGNETKGRCSQANKTKGGCSKEKLELGRSEVGPSNQPRPCRLRNVPRSRKARVVGPSDSDKKQYCVAQRLSGWHA